MIPAAISEKVLTIGPDYKNHRGGIGALLATYKDQYERFNFLPTYKYFKNNLSKSLFFLVQIVRISLYLYRNKKLKIIHIHSAKKGSLYRKLIIVIIAKVLFNKKIINHIHTGHFKHFYDDSNWVVKKCIRYYLKLNDITLTVSDYWKMYFMKQFHLNNVFKLNNMVPEPLSGNKNMNGGTTQFLYLGIITQNKGIFDLVTVLGKHKNLLENKIKLTICGSGESVLLEYLIKEYKLEECIEFKGWIAGDEKETLLKNTDVYILPSYYEGVPISILEAMRYGKPIISTNVGGIPEIVDSNINGLLINPGDAAAILQSLLFYINDHRNIVEHGHNSLLKIDAYYPKAITRQLTTIYSTLIN